MVGVMINHVNSITEWGLILLDDLVISAPNVKKEHVDLPGINGILDYSEALTGYPLFEMRTITFTLWKRMDEAERARIRTDLLGRFGGRIVQLITPDLPEFYWRGRLSMGDYGGFNSGHIPLSFEVYPYRLKNDETVKTLFLTADTEREITLDNAGMPTVPTIRCTQNCTITLDGTSYTIPANTDYRNNSLLISGLEAVITAKASTDGMLTITYQEGTL